MFSFSLFIQEEKHSDILAKCLQIDRFFSDHYAEKLMQARLQAAKKLLISNELYINQIAERCGYTTLRGFELFFEKKTNMLPNEYRRIQQSDLERPSK